MTPASTASSSRDSTCGGGPCRVAPKNPWIELDVPLDPPAGADPMPCFGVGPGEVVCTPMDGFDAPIPSVLVVLRKEMERLGGMYREGIFRLAPQQEDMMHIKGVLQRGGFGFASCGCFEDPYLAATLIKEWFRDLPVPLLSVVDAGYLVNAAGGDQHQALAVVCENFPDPFRSWFLFLLDTLAIIMVNERFNRMNSRNLATVFTPNLLDPGRLLSLTSGAVAFLVSALDSYAAFTYGWYGLQYMPPDILPIDAGVYGEAVPEEPDENDVDGSMQRWPVVGEVFNF
mmetsp:Transcript_34754/g.109127  ORF Transcript_34754/g.109127 Transcript_34754/m.109127 type:complete len:286 (-) Transcript_34754:171-1028(-)